jgi:hypothetical protein
MPRPRSGLRLPVSASAGRVPFLQLGVGRPAAATTLAEEAWTVRLRGRGSLWRRFPSEGGPRQVFCAGLRFPRARGRGCKG